MVQYKVSKEESGQTLEKYVRKVLNYAPLSFIYKLFRKKDVKINGHWADMKAIVNDGDEIKIYATNEQLASFRKEKELEKEDLISEYLVYEDDNILVINKPRNLLVIKDETNQKSLTDMVLSYLYLKGEYDPHKDLAFTPGPAHRIDRNTSGLVIFGKNIKTLQYLYQVIKEKEVISKHYVALVKGSVEKDGEVEAPLKKDESTNKVVVAAKNDGGKEAKTTYHVIKRYKEYSLLDLTLYTGRTHQIRVHMSYIGHPLVGDAKYGDYKVNHDFDKEYHFKNQFLHASEIHLGKLEAPLQYLSKKSFIAPLNNELSDIIKKIEQSEE